MALGLLGSIFVLGTIGYAVLGFSVLDAMYQTITTITTVGFREVQPFGQAEKWFTMLLIVLGVGTVLYTFTLAVQLVVEGQLGDILGRRRMDRKIAQLRDHVVVCGLGRVGRAATADIRAGGRDVVVVDADADRLAGVDGYVVIGDATLDATLRTAGVDRASALVAALSSDAANLFVTLSGRSMKPDLFIVARAREDDSVPKLTRAGADRVVNPQELGAARMASFVVQPNVAEFVDVVMHERSMEFRMQEVELTDASPLSGRSLRDANLRQATNVLVLAVRQPDGSFVANPDPATVLSSKDVIIAVGTDDDLRRLVAYCR